MSKLLKKLENRLIAKKTHQLDRTPMWFLACEEEELRRRTDIDAEVLETLLSLRENGYAILRNNVPHALCDEVIREFEEHCASEKESEQYADEYGLHSRLALFHYKSDPALEIALLKRTTDVVRTGFGGDFTIVGSLLFERGSTQDVHRDTPAFFTNPLNHFFGVWNALEDVREGSGELCYFTGGHRVIRDTDLYDDPAINIDNYFAAVENACWEAGLDLEKFRPRKGDTLIWLPELPHGGSRREDKAASRRSIVFHYLPTGTPLHGAKEFFDRDKPLYCEENYSVLVRRGARMIDMGRTRFYHNHKEGNFEEG